METEIEVVWLIDADPPSPLGGRAFYPEVVGGAPPDPVLMASRFIALRSAAAEAGVSAVVTLHTSPRHRSTFFSSPYIDEWRACLDAGIALALHPHEDQEDGTNRYADAAHLARVVTEGMAAARAAELPIAAFRSGTFAWNAALPRLLQEAGVPLDLSPGPGLSMPEKNAVWPAEADTAPYAGTCVIAVPIGWSGRGSDLGRDYLFVERMDFDSLIAVWDAIRARVQRRACKAVCNLLSHGFGLADPAWRSLSLRFLDHIRAHGGAVISAAEATHAHHP